MLAANSLGMIRTTALEAQAARRMPAPPPSSDEHHALRKREARELPAARAGGLADGDLLLAAGGPGKQEVPDIRRDDQLDAEADRQEEASVGPITVCPPHGHLESGTTRWCASRLPLG